MAEGFEPYHVPQQSRRDKLRVGGCVDNLQGCAGLLPAYDPSLIGPDLLTCANSHASPVKQEGMNLAHYAGGFINNANNNSSSSSSSQHLYMDPQSSIHINPNPIQEINCNTLLYSPQNLRFFDQSFNGGEVLVYKPEPLSLSLSSSHNPYVMGSDLSRSSVPLGPFTGYSSILKGSRFLRPAQQLLEEICDVGRGVYAENVAAETGLMEGENLGGSGVGDAAVSGGDGAGDGGEQLRKKSRLISMLDEVYRRYKYYYQQMQAVIASFESVAGLSNAAPFANLAIKAMSKHFRSLKNAITDQLQFLSKAQNYQKDGSPRFGNSDNVYSQRPIHNNSGFLDQPVWRPQRGLPERAVTVLRSWLFDHFLHPYPTDTDKIMLAKQTGLSRNQVSNWFINARVRLWKPMVEEIHMLETRQATKAPQREELSADRPGDHLLPTPTSLPSENPSTSTQRAQDLPSKRTRNEFADISMGTEDQVRLSYQNLSRHQHVGTGMSTGGGSGGVSLTLGLHQNSGFGLSEPFPINAARRFGLDTNSEGYVVGSFEDQNRQFGRDVIGGQLLHDFVG
ncbi:BEL1-like homeodomain protein 9 [Actinidia chinensis var. chinensis]|uniref:BEL1-like homeodomain protein 9 n=1 Tax=Actinidia chinensis var. chinensis TaxID=1590841 RepID=A0A2R6RX44_ACTCC|nr:BEL1-like homeodomain protein 9 [Actinidia chinensis var. chinensis]